MAFGSATNLLLLGFNHCEGVDGDEVSAVVAGAGVGPDRDVVSGAGGGADESAAAAHFEWLRMKATTFHTSSSFFGSEAPKPTIRVPGTPSAITLKMS